MNTNSNSKTMELSLLQIILEMLRKAWLIAIVAIAGMAVAFMVTYFLVTPKYEAAAMFYVNNSQDKDAGSGVTSSDISASKSLVDSYIVILNTRDTLEGIIEYAGLDLTYKQLGDMISATSVNSTEIFEIVVTSEDPEEAKALADAVTHVFPNRISSIIEGSSASVVEHASMPLKPSSPSYPMNLVLGFLLGALFSAVYVIIRLVSDVTVRSEEDVTKASDLPILAVVPDMSAPSKGGYYSGSKHSRKRTPFQSGKGELGIITEEDSFSASEAYKVLRTKLLFSFADDSKCRIIGISSAMAGEGKSVTSVNAAYALAQLDKRVLLIDCDMRRPSVFSKLNLTRIPGLSDFLTGQRELGELIQRRTLKGVDLPFGVIAAGRTPPNPVELISSERMRQMLQVLRKNFDYIIVDLPPVGEVSDAMVAAKLVDGILLVVRQNYGSRVALASALEQFRFIQTKMLGLVLNSANEHGKGYGKKYKYNKYYAYRSSQRSTPKKIEDKAEEVSEQ